MSADLRIDDIYSIETNVSSDALAEVFAVRADLEKFDYGKLYAYTQVEGDDLNVRANNAKRFAEKIAQKQLDNDTVKTILETQQTTLPRQELSLIRASNIADLKFFELYHCKTQYLLQDQVQTVFDSGIDNGKACVVGELVNTSTDWQDITTLDNASKLRISRDIANGLKLLHKSHIPHGALRPSVIAFSGADNRATLCCWAIIPSLDKALESGGGQNLKDVFEFCAPEVLSGVQPGLSSDIYSLGMLMYYMFCSSKPWAQTGTLFDLLETMQKGALPYADEDFSVIPQEIASVILLATMPEKENRYKTITEMLDDIIACINNKKPQALKIVGEIKKVDDLPPASEPAEQETAPEAMEPQTSAAPTASVEPEAQNDPQAPTSAGTQAIAETKTAAPDAHAAPQAAPKTEPKTEEQQPLFQEPQLPDFSSDNTEINKSGTGMLVKAAAAAVVVVACAGLGYYYLGKAPQNSPESAGTEQSSPKPTAPATELVNNTADTSKSDTTQTASGKNDAASDYKQLIAKGKAALEKKENAQAVEFFEKALAINNSKEATELLEKAKEGDEERQKREAAITLAERMISANNLDAAETSVLEVLNMPGNAADRQALNLIKKIRDTKFKQAMSKAQAQGAAGNWQQAYMLYSWATSIQGYEDNPEALAAQKRAMKEVAQLKARQLKEQQKKLQLKSQYDAAMREAKNKAEQQRWEEAVAAYDLALTIEGYTNDATAREGKQQVIKLAKEQKDKLAKELKQKRESEFSQLMQTATALLKASKWAQAEQTFTEAMGIEGYSQNLKARDGRAQAIAGSSAAKLRAEYDGLLKEGFTLINASKFKEAEQKFRDALKIKGFNKGAIARQGMMLAETMHKTSLKRTKYLQHINSGNAFEKSGRYTQAALEYGRAIVLEPKRQEGYLLRANAYAKSGEADKALENLQIILKNNPKNFQTLSAQVAAFCAAEQFPQAVQALNKILTLPLKPQQKAWAQSTLGWIYFSPSMWGGGHKGIKSDNDNAVELFTLAVKDGSAAAMNNLGVAYALGRGIKRDNKAAFDLFSRAAQAKLPQALFNMGQAYYDGKLVDRDYAKALEYFTQAAKAQMPRASGRIAQMYQRGQGVERDDAKARQYAAANDGKTDRSDSFEMCEAELTINTDTNATYPLVDKDELARQYESIISEAKVLLRQKHFTSAQRIAELATMLSGYANDKNALELGQSAIAMQKRLEADVATAAAQPPVVPTAPATPDSPVAPVAPTTPATDSPKSVQSTPKQATTDPLLNLSNLPQEPGAPKIAKAQDNTPTPKAQTPVAKTPKQTQPTKPQQESASSFSSYYQQLTEEAKNQMNQKRWGIAEQAFRLAMSLPGDFDKSQARSGMQAAMQQKRQAVAAGKAKYTDYEAVMNNASTSLREKQWPQAIHLFDYAMTLDGFSNDRIAQIGKAAANKAVSINSTPLPDTAPIAKGDTRDMASYQTAMKQGQEFVAQKKFKAAQQMAEIILNMQGFENDQAALALLAAARSGRALVETSPEVQAQNRQKNRAVYEQLILTGKMHIKNGDNDKAEQALKLIFKLAGYETDNQARQLLNQLRKPQAKPVQLTPEQQAQYLALMKLGQQALDEKDWVKAEETFRIIMQIAGFENDHKAQAGLNTALAAQNKQPQNTQPASSASQARLTEGFITDQDDVSAIKHKAEFDALMREGRRQFELMQFEVAEAVFAEALKIKGYENNPEANTLLQQARANKPKAKDIKAPERKDEHAQTSPQQEMKKQSVLLMNDGNRLRAEGRLKDALQAYSSGIDLDRENPQLRINRGDTYAQLGQFELALSDYNKALEMPATGASQQAYIWNNIANVHYYGKKDFKTAVEFYTKSAQGGNPAAMNSLGVCYGFGRGVSKDPTKALEWYNSAAALNYGNAMLNLGLLYQNGWGVSVDNLKAFSWYQKAAERNVPRAYARVALMYKEGLGVEKDLQKAQEYRNKAIALGYKKER